ncbi:TPA: hypothetical protein ENG04_04030 [Candidatus Poribacteria bacterium]|nr:hypothetical protein [Candidatus Poribacteria bacterium]HEX29229.1 hypothetical protein [Candidatus Poribacteria bacterium]
MTLTELFETIKEHLGDEFQPKFEKVCEQFGCRPVAAKESLKDKLFDLGCDLDTAEEIAYFGLFEEFTYHPDTGWTLSASISFLDILATDEEMEDELGDEIDKLVEEYQIEATREISARLERRLMDLGWIR